jgi:hypothetical protein
MAKKMRYDSKSFDVKTLQNSNLVQSLVGAETRFDSAEDASVFFARELDHVKAKSYDKQYPELTSFSLFPHTSEADPGDETITYYGYDKVGMASIINNYATDLPRADVKGSPETAQIKSIGASYGYSVQEMRASRKAGKGLDHRKAESARYQVDRMLNKIAWAGDEANNLMGVLTKTNNIPYAAISEISRTDGTKAKKWADKDADEILADINGMMATVSRNTKNVERPNTLVLPTDVFIDISTRRIPMTETTVKDFVQEHAPYLKEIVAASELNADSTETNPFAAAENGENVAFFFTKDADKLAVEDPMPYYQYPVQERNLEVVVPCEARTAGVIIYYPLSALIAVGI